MKMNIRTLFGLAAVAGLLAVAAPAERAQALSLITPGAASSSGQVTDGAIIDVRGGRGHHRGWGRGHHRGWGHHHRHRHHGWRHRHHRHWR